MKPTRSHALIILTLVFAVLFLGASGLALAKDPTPPAAGSPSAEPLAPAITLGTAFTYQGRLNDGGNAANGAYDLQFKLFDAASGGTQIGGTVSKNDLAVSGGLFTTDLDFGAGAFDGQARWLEIAVRPGASTGAYTTLTPRRPLLASPYATYSNVTRGITIDGSGNVDYNRLSKLDIAEEGYSAIIRARDLDFGSSTRRGTPGRALVDSSSRLTINYAGDWAGGVLIDSNLDVEGSVDINGAIVIRARDLNFGSSTRRGEPGRALVDSSSRLTINYASDWAGGVLIDSNAQINGTTQTNVLQITGGADLAEPFAITDRPEPGLVVAIDPDHIGQLRIADKAYDRTVAGVISGAGGLQPGLTMQQPEVVQGETHPVALTGRVYVWADASFGAIQPGDLLTTSATPGHAMKAGDYAQAQGAILGKAMSRLAEGKGLVLVLVSLQ